MGVVSIYLFIASHPLTRDHKLSAVFRCVSWQVRSRFKRTIVHPWVNDTRLVVSRGMRGATGNIYAGLHDFEDMSFVLHFLRPGSLFVDVGANVGTYTVLASAGTGAITISLEPVPTTFQHLLRNLEENRIQDRVEPHRLAASSAKEMLRFTSAFDAQNRVANPGMADAIEVQADTLDGVLHSRHPEMIKIDVEGFETRVLQGAQALLEDPALRAILLEVVNSGPGMDPEAIARRHGFSPYCYDPFTRNLAARTGPPTGKNSLMIRDLGFVQDRLRTGPSFRVLARSI